jgi:hypothetical protein
LLPK